MTRPTGRPRKLDYERAQMIRVLAQAGFSGTAIARAFGVHEGSVRAIVNHITYLGPRREDDGLDSISMAAPAAGLADRD